MNSSISKYNALHCVRTARPLVHNITNYVVMNWTANCLLAIGASPLMSHALEEQEAMTQICHALVINIGTLDAPWSASMKAAMHAACKNDKPIIFDPVGAGASEFRTQTCLSLLRSTSPTVIRGNASEILALAGHSHTSRGVDSNADSTSAIEAAKKLAQTFQCVVCVSGQIDYIVNAKHIACVHNGHEMMTRVTGMGCAATALIGAFVALQPNSVFDATLSAMVVTDVAGELAQQRSQGPGTFQIHYLDALHNLTEESLTQMQRVTYESF